MPLSIRDLSKEAKVSIATISRVLNDMPGVGAATRARIKALIEKRGFVPNHFSRGLSGKSSKIVGVLVPNLRDLNYAMTANAVQQDLMANGYSTLLGCTGHCLEQTGKYIREFVSRMVDGIILTGTAFNDERVENMLLSIAKHIPVIMTNSPFNKRNVQSVIIDVAGGIFDCCEYLIKKGRRRIAFVGDSANPVSSTKKLDGYKSALEKNGIPFDGRLCYVCDFTVDAGYELAGELIDKIGEFSAIVCSGDELAMGIARKFLERGISIPKDIAITGYNNSFFSQYIVPSLTTVDNQHDVVGSMAVDLLMKTLGGKKMNLNLSVRPVLVVRESA